MDFKFTVESYRNLNRIQLLTVNGALNKCIF